MHDDGGQPGYQPRHARSGGSPSGSRRGGAGRHAAQAKRPRTVAPLNPPGRADLGVPPPRNRWHQATARKVTGPGEPTPAGRRSPAAAPALAPDATEISLEP